MSRIHEALKKAEQERAAAQAGQAQSHPGSELPAAEPPAVAAADAPRSLESAENFVAERPAAQTMPSLTNFAGPETLLARCRQLEWKPEEKTMLFFNGNDSMRGTEEFRTLRSRLYVAREKMALKKVLVTSALPKEGKSFTAANLAQVMARQHGRRVLLIDADLRGPRLHEMLGTSAVPGLSDYLQGNIDEFSIMQRGPMENLFFIPGGAEISNPAELVAGERLRVLLQRVENLFDWIILDSPPAIPVSDASVLAKTCEGVLIVVRSNATPTNMARRVREEFPEQSLVGVVLNGMDHQTSDYLQYYYETYVQETNESKS
jgi:protein-tyrosine kinase